MGRKRRSLEETLTYYTERTRDFIGFQHRLCTKIEVIPVSEVRSFLRGSGVSHLTQLVLAKLEEEKFIHVEESMGLIYLTNLEEAKHGK